MGLEDITSGSTLADLVLTNPADGDDIAQGDDHIRNLKKALQYTFMNLSATVSSVAAELDIAHKGGTISGALMVKDTLTVSGASVLQDTLSVSGAAVMKSTLTVESTLTVSAATVMKSGLTCDGTATFSGTVVAKAGVIGGGGNFIGFPKINVYTSNDTWVKPSGLVGLKVTVIGGGGGGGGGGSDEKIGGGGGGGGASIEYIDESSVSASVSISVGTGGTAGAFASAGGDGNTSSFGAYLQATGGYGGADPGANASDEGKGGIGSDGDLNFQGGAGGHPVWAAGSAGAGGEGGDSHMGGGGNCAGTNQNGNAGGAYGGGGSGGYKVTTGSPTGGAGADGVVIVEEFY